MQLWFFFFFIQVEGFQTSGFRDLCEVTLRHQVQIKVKLIVHRFWILRTISPGYILSSWGIVFLHPGLSTRISNRETCAKEETAPALCVTLTFHAPYRSRLVQVMSSNRSARRPVMETVKQWTGLPMKELQSFLLPLIQQIYPIRHASSLHGIWPDPSFDAI